MGGRHVVVALDSSSSSKYALTWALENIIRHGDYILIIMVKKMEDEDGVTNLWEDSGSPLVTLNKMKDPSVSRKYHIAYNNALLEELDAAAKAKHLTVTSKVYFGDAKMKITNAIAEHSVDCLVMGNRGQGTIKGVLMGSVSNYVVNNVPCPVTIVKLLEHV